MSGAIYSPTGQRLSGDEPAAADTGATAGRGHRLKAQVAPIDVAPDGPAHAARNAAGRTPASPIAQRRQRTVEAAEEDINQYREKVEAMRENNGDGWLVSFIDNSRSGSSLSSKLAASSSSDSALLQILNGTDAEVREAFGKIVPRPPSPGSAYQQQQHQPPPPIGVTTTGSSPLNVPLPSFGSGAVEPEPEPQLPVPVALPPNLNGVGVGITLGHPPADAPAQPAGDIMPSSASTTSRIAAPAPADAPPGADEAAEALHQAEIFWRLYLSDRTSSFVAAFCCHCVLAGEPLTTECSAVLIVASDALHVVREEAVVDGAPRRQSSVSR